VFLPAHTLPDASQTWGSVMTIGRREFVGTATVAVSALWTRTAPGRVRLNPSAGPLHLSSNTYPWSTFYGREQREFRMLDEACLAEVAASGLQGLEPGISDPAEIDALAPLLVRHRLEMRSVYMNSQLHDAEQGEASIAQIVAVARRARDAGTRIIVTNPSPLQWGGEQDKTDAQLAVQAQALNRLGAQLKALDVTLAYHNHDMELRCAAREFHHMMVGTDPDLVTLCLDAHWIYRGSSNSAVALFDIVQLYGPRVTELHVRQSRDHIWTEVFEEGDIDYTRLVALLQSQPVRPLVVLEQAVEQGSPHTLTAVEAHRRGCEHARRVFAPLAAS
jgi:inosose dehydratase